MSKPWLAHVSFQKLQGCSCQYLNANWQGIFINIETWMMMGITGPLVLILCSHHEVAVRHHVQEVTHILTTRRHHFFALIYFILALGLCGCVLYDLCHFLILHTGWTPPLGKPGYAGGPLRTCHP